jgi:catechol 2,3-dioxygenase-like lactoylglutathione lyase family enzyme
MPGIDGLTHIGITVKDLETSIGFYTKNFGFKLVRRGSFNREFFEANPPLYNLSDISCETALLKTTNDVQIELFQFSRQMPYEKMSWNRQGITHIAFAANSVSEICETLKDNGLEFFMKLRIRPDGGKLMWIRDPDGNLIEIMEPFKDS